MEEKKNVQRPTMVVNLYGGPGAGKTTAAWELGAELKKQGVVNCYALVAEPEQEDEYLTRDSIHFHEKMGYTIAGTLHFSGCKFGRWYHLTTLEKFLGDHGTKMEAIKPYKAVR